MYECYRPGRISKRIYAASLLKGGMRGKSAGKRGTKDANTEGRDKFMIMVPGLREC